MRKSVIGDYGALVYLRRSVQCCSRALGKYEKATNVEDKEVYLAAAKQFGLTIAKQLKGIRPKMAKCMSICNYVDAVNKYCAPSTSVFNSISDEEIAKCLSALCAGDNLQEINLLIAQYGEE